MKTQKKLLIIFLLCYSEVSSTIVDSNKVMSDTFISKINKLQNSWKAGRNFHRNSELKNLVGIVHRKKDVIGVMKSNTFKINITSFDSRQKWSQCMTIGKVMTQGNCASSYAIVPSMIFTDRYCIKKNITRPSSADMILSCCKSCGGGCFGGVVERSFLYMKKVGLVTGGGYGSSDGCRPYQIKSCPMKKLPFCRKIRSKTPFCYLMKCTNKKYKPEYAFDKLKIGKIYALPKDANAIKSEIQQHGPVSATMNVYEDFFNYKNGIYRYTMGNKIGIQVVKLIGWNISKDLQPYWLAVNSWGKKWGEQGLFKIAMGVNECGIESKVLAGLF